MLDEFVDIIVDFPNSLPPIRSISHHIDLIPRASFPNKETTKRPHKRMKRLKEGTRVVRQRFGEGEFESM
jgi:hypothetical protein